jgi:hypothetical protein
MQTVLSLQELCITKVARCLANKEDALKLPLPETLQWRIYTEVSIKAYKILVICLPCDSVEAWKTVEGLLQWGLTREIKTCDTCDDSNFILHFSDRLHGGLAILREETTMVEYDLVVVVVSSNYSGIWDDPDRALLNNTKIMLVVCNRSAEDIGAYLGSVRRLTGKELQCRIFFQHGRAIHADFYDHQQLMIRICQVVTELDSVRFRDLKNPRDDMAFHYGKSICKACLSRPKSKYTRAGGSGVVRPLPARLQHSLVLLEKSSTSAAADGGHETSH